MQTMVKILKKKEGRTLKGKPKFEFQADGGKGAFWFYTTDLSCPYVPGDEVEVELQKLGNSWWLSSNGGGRQTGRAQSEGVSYEIFKDIQEIKSNVEKILKMVTSTGHVMGSASEEPPVPRDEDAPIETDEIPF